MKKTFGILLIILFLQLPAFDICNGDPPKTPGKPSQKPQFITSNEASVLAKREIDESLVKLKETYDKQLLELANQKLQISQAIFSGIAWGAGITAGLLAFLSFFGIRLSKQWIKDIFEDLLEKDIADIKKEITEREREELEKQKLSIEGEIQEAKKDILAKANADFKDLSTRLEKTEQDFNISRARFLNNVGVTQWISSRGQTKDLKEELIRLAIKDTEDALKLNPTSDESLFIQIKSNLSYYYAELKLQDKKDIALSYAKDAIELFPKYREEALGWVTNYGYVRMIFASTLEELDEIIRYLEWLEKTYPSVREEVREYLAIAYEKRQNLIKN